MFKSTHSNTNWWKNRKIDWNASYLSTWDHPHRMILSAILRSVPFTSLFEIGCGPGANLVRIVKDMPGKQLGGCDVNPDAIELAKQTFGGGRFYVDKGNDTMLSDKSVDVVLSDMVLIYVDPLSIRSYLKEMKRIGRNHVVLCEFHSKSWWKRLVARLKGYHVYDYYKLLENAGFYNVTVQHIPQELWPGTDYNTEFRSIITARIPHEL